MCASASHTVNFLLRDDPVTQRRAMVLCFGGAVLSSAKGGAYKHQRVLLQMSRSVSCAAALCYPAATVGIAYLIFTLPHVVAAAAAAAAVVAAAAAVTTFRSMLGTVLKTSCSVCVVSMK